MSSPQTSHKCERCGIELAAYAPEGLCPGCMLEGGLDSQAPTVRATPESLLSEASSPIDDGEKIGPYKVLQEIGQGGCGIVYMAEQERPVRRRVALKVIKLGMDTRQVIARFEAERQALALMDHPNIAKVLDAGSTETGRPYFVMELVRGIKLTEYCDQNNLATAERLGLFIQVCKAIQHAHQKGIIHRDIKPSNILVTLHDGVPVPKVIDFGIAKATSGQPLSDKTVFTAFEQFIGTPAYMSPEQAEMSGLDIDTRSDIYALGVLLYELLTGRTPFDSRRLVEAGLDEIRRIIREEEPPRPSTRISTLNVGEQTTVAKRRQSEPPKLLHLIRGDLDWIVMKCLEKDRTRRYESASGLAMDIQRHLNQEPVTAVAPSTWYKFQKFARRNKGALAAGATIVFLLVSGVVASTWLAVRANSLRHDSESANAQLRVQQDLTAQVATRFELQRAEELFLSDAPKALATLARMLREQPTNRVVAERLLNALEQRSFWVPALAPFTNAYLVRYSADGQRFATAATFADETSIHINDRTGKMVSELLSPGTARAKALEFSPDRAFIAMGTANRIRAWRLEPTTPLLDQVVTSNGDLREVRVLPQNRLLLMAGERVAIWQTNGVVLHELTNHSGLFRQLALSSEAGLLALADDDSTLRICDLDSLETKRTIPAAYTNVIRSLRFNRDGSRLLSAGADSAANLWNTKTGERVASLQHSNAVRCAEFSSDGLRIVTATRDGTAQLWTVSGEPIGASMQHEGAVNMARFSPDGRQVVTACDDCTVRLWDVDTLTEIAIPARFAGPVQEAFFTPDVSNLLVVGAASGAHVLSRTPGISLHRTNAVPPGPVTITSAEKSAFAAGHAGEIRFVDVSPNGEYAVTASADKNAMIWDRKKKERLGEPLLHDAPVNCARFSPDNHRVVTSTVGNTVRLWDVRTGAPLSDPFDSDRPLTEVWFAPDGTAIFTDAGWSCPIHTVAGPIPDSLPDLADAVAGQRYDEKWILRPLQPDAFLRFRTKAETTAATDAISVWMKQFVSATTPKLSRLTNSP